MSAEEFANKHAGGLFIVPPSCVPEEMRSPFEDFAYYAQVVGYFPGSGDNRVAVEFDEKSFRKHCWPIHKGVQLTIDKLNLYEKKNPQLFAVDYRLLKDANAAGSYKCEDEIKIPQTYNARCDKCGKASRKYGKLNLCSNDKCNARGKIKKALKIPYFKQKIMLCPYKGYNDGKVMVCGAKVVFVRCYSRQDRTWQFTCDKNHNFHKQSNELIKDEVVLQHISGGMGDRYWDGQSWQTC